MWILTRNKRLTILIHIRNSWGLVSPAGSDGVKRLPLVQNTPLLAHTEARNKASHPLTYQHDVVGDFWRCNHMI